MVGTRSALLLVAPIFVWFLYFLMIYGLHALSCVKVWPSGPTIAAEMTLTCAAFALEGWCMWIVVRDRMAGDFYRLAGLGVGYLAILATLWVGAMIWFVPPCL